MATVVQKYSGATAVRTTYSSVYNTSAKGTPAPVVGSQAATYNRAQTTQTTTYNSRGATAPPVSIASAGTQAGTVVVKVSGTTTSRITTPAVTASSNYVTTTAGRANTSKQVGTPAVVATNSVKTTNTGASTTRITTPAVTAGHVTTTGSSGNTKSVGTPAVTVYTASDGSIHTLRKAETMQNMTSEQFEQISQSKNLKAPATEENNFMDGVHNALDMAGYIPAVGDLADLINSVIYATEGDWTNAVISAAGAFVDGATAGRLGAKASQEIVKDAIDTVATKTIKNGAGKATGEVATNVGWDIAEEAWNQISEYMDEGIGKSFNKYDPKQIEKMYDLYKGQFHREIKPDILADLSSNNSPYKELMRKMGKNPDIYLSAGGQIQIVSTQFKGKSFITDLNIADFLP